MSLPIFIIAGVAMAIEVFEILDDKPGWYWWSRLPGCTPECNPIGPFETQVEALADAKCEAEAQMLAFSTLTRKIR
jgi:hypothetical protein